MTPKKRLAAALRFEEPDRPPHFEQTFELEKEAFGLAHPGEKEIEAASGPERERLFARCAEIYARTVQEFGWDAALVWRPAMRNEAQYEFIPFLKRYLGPDVPVGSFVWGSSISIDMVSDYVRFSVDLYEDIGKLHAWAQSMLDSSREHARRLIDAGCDLIDIASDYAFNSGVFISPKHFRSLVTPYVADLVSFIKKNGVTVILHSDGNLMGVMDQIFEMAPHVLQSIDPMAGMDIAEVKKLTYGKIALMGNVNCSLVQKGPTERIIESACYCIDHAAPGGGFIYSSSNTIFKGVPLENYRAMVEYMRGRF